MNTPCIITKIIYERVVVHISADRHGRSPDAFIRKQELPRKEYKERSILLVKYALKLGFKMKAHEMYSSQHNFV